MTSDASVLIVGSGRSALDINYYNLNLFRIIVVNNGHLSCDEWEFWVHPDDFVGAKPILKKTQKEISYKEYINSINKNGGPIKCGHSIVLNASYWALDILKPKYIYYLGADMNYTPDENGNTHIYGIGNDLKKNKISDPDLMIKKYGNGDEDFLTKIYNRFYNIAKKNSTEVYNLSKDIQTRLPFPKITEQDRVEFLK